jgi:NADH-quinone oxidoreductase subunit N
MNYLFYFKDLEYIFPEIYIVITILLYLLFGVLCVNGDSNKNPYIISILFKVSLPIFFILALIVFVQYNESSIILYSRILINNYVILMKLFLIIFMWLFILMSLNYFKFDSIKSYEFLLLVFLSILGMFVMISSFDFTIMYLALELQTICFYVLAAYKTQSNLSTEAGIKYFVLGSFSSGLLLFGISLIYGFTGTTNFQDLSYLLYNLNNISIGALILGFLFIIVGLLFKLGAAPFHIWLPDVYDGSPTIVTGFFSSITKIPVFILFVNFIYVVFYSFNEYSHIFILLCAVCSLFIGGLGALYQNKVKRLIAYSSISHMGFMLLGIATGSLQGLQAVSIYLIVYLLLTLNFFSILFGVRKFIDGGKIKTLQDFRPLFKSNPIIGVVLSLNLFSYAGIPPLAGFFGKFYVLSVSLNTGVYFIIFLAVLFSIISSVYYIRLIKLMFFEKSEKWALYRPFATGVSLVLGYTTVLNLFFFVYVAPLIVIIQNSIYMSFV